jgi:hypothetical protein
MKNGDWRVNKSPSHRPEARKAKYKAKKAQVFQLLGNKCSHCSFCDVRALQIDHVAGGGSKERKRLNGIPFLEKVLKDIEATNGTYQLLCANCNWIKRSESETEQTKGKRSPEIWDL